jgi:hypothetical protein
MRESKKTTNPRTRILKKTQQMGRTQKKRTGGRTEKTNKKIMESTTLDDVLVDDDINIKVEQKKAIQPTWFPSRAVVQNSYQ